MSICHTFENDNALTAVGVKRHLTLERMNEDHLFDTILPPVPDMFQPYVFQVRCMENFVVATA